jgi:hypothetical protein
MSRNTTRFDAAVETFTNQGLSQREAEAYVSRRIAGLGRQEAARWLDIEPSTLDTLVERAKDKDPQLPGISKVDYPDSTKDREVAAARIWFENGAQLRYVKREHEDGTVTLSEETFGADDPHSVLESFEVGGEGDDVVAFALESISEYLQSYRDPETCRRDWPHVFEAITLHDA